VVEQAFAAIIMPRGGGGGGGGPMTGQCAAKCSMTARWADEVEAHLDAVECFAPSGLQPVFAASVRAGEWPHRPRSAPACARTRPGRTELGSRGRHHIAQRWLEDWPPATTKNREVPPALYEIARAVLGHRCVPLAAFLLPGRPEQAAQEWTPRPPNAEYQGLSERIGPTGEVSFVRACPPRRSILAAKIERASRRSRPRFGPFLARTRLGRSAGERNRAARRLRPPR